MLKSLAALAVLASATAPAQVITSYEASNPAPIKGDANKVVCQKEETIGTRLGAKKVCMTVAEWQARQAADRDQVERVQGGTRGPCAEDPTCGMGPPH